MNRPPWWRVAAGLCRQEYPNLTDEQAYAVMERRTKEMVEREFQRLLRRVKG